MKKRLNKAVGDSFDALVKEGISVKIKIPGETLLSLGITIALLTFLVLAMMYGYKRLNNN